MAIPQIARDFGYQGLQLLVLAPASALIAKTQAVSRFLPKFETLLNLNTWKDKLTEAWDGPQTQEGVKLRAFDWNPLSESNRETVMIATTIALTTTTLFQLLRRAPGFKNSPGTTFAFSACVSFTSLYAASAYGLLPTNQSNVAEVFKNILLIGTGITTSAKLFDLAREKVFGPMLTFADLLSPVTSGSTTQPPSDQDIGHSHARKNDSTPVQEDQSGGFSRRSKVRREEAYPKSPTKTSKYIPRLDDDESSSDEEPPVRRSIKTPKHASPLVDKEYSNEEEPPVRRSIKSPKHTSPSVDKEYSSDEYSSDEESPVRRSIKSPKHTSPSVDKEYSSDEYSSDEESPVRRPKASSDILKESYLPGNALNNREDRDIRSKTQRRKKTTSTPVSSDTLPSPSKLNERALKKELSESRDSRSSPVGKSSSAPPTDKGESGAIHQTEEF